MSIDTIEEEGNMKAPDGTLRTMACLLFVLLIVTALAACGGGSSTSSSGTPGVAGPVSVNVTLGGADVAPPVSEIPTNLLAPLSLSPADAAAPGMMPSRATFRHVYVYMTGVAFIPVETMPPSDLRPPLKDGEVMFDGPEDDFNPKFVVYTFPKPVVFDLLNPPTGREIAKFLNKIEVPAGVYHKIRVYYQQVKVVVDGEGVEGVVAHRTANGHLDIHFKAASSWDADDVHVDDHGYLVIPVAPNPADGVRLYCVAIEVTGLKVHETGNGKIIVRPQVFAKLTRPVRYSITGTAENVDHETRSFDINTSGGTIFPASYGATTDWAYIDNTVDPVWRSSAVGEALGASGLDNGAHVDAIGTFSSNNVLLATDVDITFPDLLTGKVYIGWNNSTNTFDLRPPVPLGDNTVFPMPTRTTAYYDNAVDLSRLYDTSISDNAAIIARGYKKVGGGIDAFWISIGRLYSPGP